MVFFKTTDEEPNVEGSQLREFILEVESTARTWMKRLLSQVTNGNCMPVFMNAGRDWLTQDPQEQSSAERPQKGVLRLTSAGKQRIELWLRGSQCDQIIDSGYFTL